MCYGVFYLFQGNEIKTYFPNPHAELPVINKRGKVLLLPWGRRDNQVGELPLGGWARLASIKQGLWDPYFPKPVRLPILRFSEKDYLGANHWFDLTPGQFVQGLVATFENEQRVYVVTLTPTRLDAVIHDRWPRVVW